MSVKVESSGRRSIQVEVEVPGTPEEVWQAIASGPGISSWFAPTEFEERDGRPVAMTVNVGPGMEARSVVTAWDAPRKFVSEGDGWFPGAPPVATEWGWDRVQFLAHTCTKAGLRDDCWQRGAKVYRFAADVFGD